MITSIRHRRAELRQDRCADPDRGDTMLATCILVVFLLAASFTLISASQRWGGIRDAQAAASAAARAAAQVSEAEVRGGVRIDPVLAQARANSVLGATGHAGSVTVASDGLSVTVSASGRVEFTFPAPGVSRSVSGTGHAVATKGVNSATAAGGGG